ncbi:MAG: hypothetical protein KAJ32_07160 [Gammaproteobacteria bacterium]|nr:hypothetical protein [Gammaproteobacteria bacterium]
MLHSRILNVFFICLFISACESQEQTTPVEKTTVIKAAPEKTTTEKPMRVLNLSIDNISSDDQRKNDDIFLKDNVPTEKNSALFETLNKVPAENSVNLSGKLLTDNNKLENKEYLESVDGVQIKIEGNFD